MYPRMIRGTRLSWSIPLRLMIKIVPIILIKMRVRCDPFDDVNLTIQTQSVVHDYS